VKVAYVALVVLALCGCRSPGSTGVTEARADQPAADPRSQGVAVVELFTSEGCSSCPPADDVLVDLARTSDAVYALSFHVDYWDGLGWPDRFASSDNTARQRAYARSFGASGVYTPQMVVGGIEQFTGSDSARAAKSVARALARPIAAHLSVRVRAVSPEAIAVDYEVVGAPADAVLDVAVVERSATSHVGAGENAGRTLHHANVVRAFVVAPLPTSTATLRVPASLRRANAEVFAYVQRPTADGGMPILVAARTPLPP
jgi:hypothetical protein